MEQGSIGKVKEANPFNISSVPPKDELPLIPTPQKGEHTRFVLVKVIDYTNEQVEKYIQRIAKGLSCMNRDI